MVEETVAVLDARALYDLAHYTALPVRCTIMAARKLAFMRRRECTLCTTAKPVKMHEGCAWSLVLIAEHP